MATLDQVAGVNSDDAAKAAFAALSTEERMAAYLNSMRKMMLFFVTVTVIALAVGVILGIVGTVELHHANEVVYSPLGS